MDDDKVDEATAAAVMYTCLKLGTVASACNRESKVYIVSSSNNWQL